MNKKTFSYFKRTTNYENSSYLISFLALQSRKQADFDH